MSTPICAGCETVSHCTRAGCIPVSPAARSSAAADRASYALAKQVPDMARGFTISTNYGEVVIPAGPTADRIAAQVAKMLDCELRMATATGQQGAAA